MGAESAFAAFEVERKELQAEIDKGLGIVDSLDERMKELRSKKDLKLFLMHSEITMRQAEILWRCPA